MRLSELLGGSDDAVIKHLVGCMRESVINELFNGPVPYKWKRENNDWIAKFQIEDLSFEAYFTFSFGTEKPEYIFGFEYLDADDTHANTGLGHEFEVFATVIAILKEFLTKKKPYAVEFYGDKSDGKGKLYDFMIKKMKSQAQSMGYAVDKTDNAEDSSKVYKITRINENGARIVKGVNTTCDVGVDEIRKQAAKFGNTVDRDGRPAHEMDEGIFSRKEQPKVSADRIERATRSDDERRAARDWEGTDHRDRVHSAATGAKRDTTPVFREPRTFGKRAR